MPPNFESNVFSAYEVIEDDEIEEYDTEEARAFSELDGPESVPQQQRSGPAKPWKPPAKARRSMRPVANVVEERQPDSPTLRSKEPLEPEPGYRIVATASVAAIVLAAIAAISRPLPIPKTASIRFGVGRVMTENAFQHATGYLLVLLSIFSLALSLRKHWSRFQFFDFPFFRVVHVIMGTATLFVLALHTGLRLGRGFEFALAIDFLAVCLLGGIAGVVTAISHRWDGKSARELRMASSRVHLIAFWPLPVLVALHVYQVYYY
jgi:hypothetical protein